MPAQNRNESQSWPVIPLTQRVAPILFDGLPGFRIEMIGFLSESPLSFEVMFHSGSYLFEITQRQLLIDGLCRFERMGLELFESHFDEVSLRNQRFVRLVMFVQRPVVEQNFMLQFLVGDALQPDRGERIAEETACGFEYGVGTSEIRESASQYARRRR